MIRNAWQKLFHMYRLNAMQKIIVQPSKLPVISVEPRLTFNKLSTGFNLHTGFYSDRGEHTRVANSL